MNQLFYEASIDHLPLGPADLHDHDPVAAPPQAPPRPLHQDVALTGRLGPTVLDVQIHLNETKGDRRLLANGEHKESECSRSNFQFRERTTRIVQTAEKAKSKQFIQLFASGQSVSQSVSQGVRSRRTQEQLKLCTAFLRSFFHLRQSFPPFRSLSRFLFPPANVFP